jgi:hypothetical protein
MKTKENAKSGKEHVDTKCGVIGTKNREKFEGEFESFRIGVLIQNARRKIRLNKLCV